MGLGVGGVELDGAPVAGDGGSRLALFEQGVAEVAVGVGGGGVEIERAAVARDGVGGQAEGRLGDAEGAHELCNGGGQLDGLSMNSTARSARPVW